MKLLFIILGSVSLLLGILGIFLPLLPTTPFLLLAATLYFRGSPRLYQWLINQKNTWNIHTEFSGTSGINPKNKNYIHITHMAHHTILHPSYFESCLFKSPIINHCHCCHLAYFIL